MTPVHLCQKNLPLNNFTTYDMESELDLFSKNNMNALYLTEITPIYWLQMLNE